MRFNASCKDAGTPCQKKKKEVPQCGLRQLQEQDCDPKCSRWLSSPCCHKDMDKLLSGRVKLTKSYWLQILSSSPVWDSANSKAYSHCCTAAGAGGESWPTYYPQRGRTVWEHLGHSAFLKGNLPFPLLPTEGWGRKTISSDTVEPEQLLCHLKVQFSSVCPAVPLWERLWELMFSCWADLLPVLGPPGTNHLLKGLLGSVVHKRAQQISPIFPTEWYLPLQRIKQSIDICQQE